MGYAFPAPFLLHGFLNLSLEMKIAAVAGQRVSVGNGFHGMIALHW